MGNLGKTCFKRSEADVAPREPEGCRGTYCGGLRDDAFRSPPPFPLPPNPQNRVFFAESTECFREDGLAFSIATDQQLYIKLLYPETTLLPPQAFELLIPQLLPVTAIQLDGVEGRRWLLGEVFTDLCRL